MYSVRIVLSEAITSLYSIHRLVFLMETFSALCEARTEFILGFKGLYYVYKG
jgi:hypothetical protein